jgi:undecaprenyl-diphosphatase
MESIQIVFLALLQGLTEFLPISSSGHLILPSQILGWQDQGLAFDVAVHVGSLVAVMGYFRKDIIAIMTAWFTSFGGEKSANSQLGWFIILATIPAGVMGFLGNDFIEANLRSILVIAITTSFFGVLLGLADKMGSKNLSIENMKLKQAMVIGFAQVLALIPGTSRSGITITAALALGLQRQDAARFSFLLSVPIIVASGGYKALELAQEASIDWQSLVLGSGVSFVSAFICIHLFLNWIDRIGMWPFVVYRLFLGAVLLMFI